MKHPKRCKCGAPFYCWLSEETKNGIRTVGVEFKCGSRWIEKCNKRKRRK